MRIHSFALAVLAVASPLLSPPRAEKPDMSVERLRETATHVVVGEVKQIWTRTEKARGWDTKHYVAEIAVHSVEKGSDLAGGALAYVRYWHREWSGLGQQPADTNGHRGLPSVGDKQRVYLARNAYDGFGDTRDGGFNVVGANGFEKP